MEFALTEEQIAFRDMARRFTQQEIVPVAAEADHTGVFPMEVGEKAFRAGLMNLHIPEEYGGPGLSVLDGCIVREEIAAGCTGIQSTLFIGGLASMPLFIAATDEQKKKWLGSLTSEFAIASYAMTEPGAGSDVAGISTVAERVGDEYVINGTKRFITGAGMAKWFTVFAMTDKEQRYNGMSCFVVPAGVPGLSLGKKEEMMGQRASFTCEVVFEDVRVPVENRIGEEGQGWEISMETFNRTRPGVAASAVGLARAALEHALRYAQERETFGKPIARHQAVNHMLADMATGVAAGRWLAWHSAWMIDRGMPNSVEASYAKAFAADMAMQVATDAVQIFGGYGYSKEFPVEKLMRDAKIFQIYEGTSQIQRQIIGRALLKEGIHMPGTADRIDRLS